jgi:hypothetical protein
MRDGFGDQVVGHCLPSGARRRNSSKKFNKKVRRVTFSAMAATPAD